jgi:hypothetical protein
MNLKPKQTKDAMMLGKMRDEVEEQKKRDVEAKARL